MGNTEKKTPRFTPGQKKTRIRVFIGSVIFYLFLAAYVYIFLQAANYGYGLLMDWLGRLEASQPGVKSQELFEDLFADPDWEELYRMAGEENTIYEGAEEYAAYMEAKVGNDKLTYVQTSAGLSKDKKYIVKHDGKRIAEFTMTNDAPEDADIPQWRLGEVFVYYTRQESLTIFTVPGHRVFINGVELDTASHVICTTETVAEEYLPEGVHGYRDMTLYFEVLLVQPEVTILDENDVPMEVRYDAETNLYSEVLPEVAQISDQQRDTVVAAGQAYGKYMITALKKSELKNYFFEDGTAFTDITSVDRYMQSYKSYEFSEAVISDFYQYSAELYSAHMSMVLYVTRSNGTVKDYTLETTFFLKPDETGNWLVDSMTNVHLQETITMVKLQFFKGNEEVQTQWVNANSAQIVLPELDIPEGKEFLGWYTKTVDGLNVSYTPVFKPSETGIVYLPESYELKPMVLYAQFL